MLSGALSWFSRQITDSSRSSCFASQYGSFYERAIWRARHHGCRKGDLNSMGACTSARLDASVMTGLLVRINLIKRASAMAA